MGDSSSQSTAPAITFWGAAQSVTGSMHLIEAEGKNILLDCGMTQGRNEESGERDRHFPFHARHIDAVILSHAHIDHCGNLPSLVRAGFRGPVYCTPATRDLIAVMLADSARIQEEDAAHANIRRQYREPTREPLYTGFDVEDALALVEPMSCGEQVQILKGIRLTLAEAGHVLGSAMVHVETASGGSLTFTGDLGRRGMPILKPSAPIPPAHVVICESTYGGCVHEPIEAAMHTLADVVRATFERGGKVLIPAFSLGRTQLIIHVLCQAMREGRIAESEIVVDSPLAAEIAEVYRRHPESLTAEARCALAADPEFLGGRLVRYVRSSRDSMQERARPGPAIIVGSSGMCEAGRIIHHIQDHIDDPRCSIVLVSFQAYGTPGRALLDRGPTVRLQGKICNKWAEVVHVNGFSGHADQQDILSAFAPLAGKVREVCLVHGERPRAEALAAGLRGIGFADVSLPESGTRIPLM